jgi:hypothetical protein
MARLMPLAALTGLAAGTIALLASARPAAAPSACDPDQAMGSSPAWSVPQPAETRDARDAAVLERALVDLLESRDSPFEPEDSKKEQLLFSPEALTYRLPVDDLLREFDAKRWAKLSPAQRRAAHDAAAEVARRVTAGDPFKPFKPKDERVTTCDRNIEEKDQGVHRSLRRRQVFHAFPPGYSRDGQIALVRMRFPWSGGHHSGEVTYVLARQDEGWTVLVRDLIFYV